METGIKKDIRIDENCREELLSNIEEEGMTIIHCQYISSHRFINGGWVNIYKSSYLVHHSGAQLGLLHAENIPLSPAKHYFNKAGIEKRFTLYFPNIPNSWKRFDFVERTGDGDGFYVRQIRRNNSGIYEVSLV